MPSIPYRPFSAVSAVPARDVPEGEYSPESGNETNGDNGYETDTSSQLPTRDTARSLVRQQPHTRDPRFPSPFRADPAAAIPRKHFPVFDRSPYVRPVVLDYYSDDGSPRDSTPHLILPMSSLCEFVASLAAALSVVENACAPQTSSESTSTEVSSPSGSSANTGNDRRNLNAAYERPLYGPQFSTSSSSSDHHRPLHALHRPRATKAPPNSAAEVGSILEED
ncbi:uncharacterized protein JCM15063_001211 [Sporobolomyces koalae]|uniref:uncharacterized protein n=1 Tax=Sporobolomyces koalae TaxID=500713 RepID=UPI00316C0C63